jgi:hypothetical protein
MGSVPDVSVIDRPRTITAEAPRVERRRPGRVENVSPELVPLLRGQVDLVVDTADRDPYDLAAATGIAVGSLISAPIWALLLWAV